MERTETKMDRELLEALRRGAAEEGREEYGARAYDLSYHMGRRIEAVTDLIETRKPGLSAPYERYGVGA